MRDVEGSGTKKTLAWRLVMSVFLVMMSERRVLLRVSISAGVKSGSHSYQKRSASRRRSNWKSRPAATSGPTLVPGRWSSLQAWSLLLL